MTSCATCIARPGQPSRKGTTPRSGHCCSALQTSLASAHRDPSWEPACIYVLHPYVVIYEGEPKGDTVVIHRIVHGRRDIGPDLIDR